MIGKTIATITIAAASVNAHGYLSKPAARNFARAINEHHTYEPQSLPAGGPGDVFENPGEYTHGLCGNSKNVAWQNWNIPGPIQGTYKEGEKIEMSAVITAHHLGYFTAQLCDKQDISEECFFENRLMRSGCTDVNDEECYRVWKPLLSMEAGTNSLGGFTENVNVVDGLSTTNIQTFDFNWDMQLPEGVTCDHCVLRWHWFTTNSCEATSDGVSGASEEFWNCADIRVEDVKNQATPSKATPAQIEALAADKPRNLYDPSIRNKNMWNFCPLKSQPRTGAAYDVATCTDCNMINVPAGEAVSGGNNGGDWNDNGPVSSDFRCGLDWSTADKTCGNVCVTNDDCANGEVCYNGLSVAPCDGAAPAPETTSSVAPETTSSVAPETTSSVAQETTSSAAQETTSSASVPEECVGSWVQCGGEGYTGPTNCCGGLTCQGNQWWMSCQ